ncbi:DUF1254 domain-containing protein [Streptomyces sp. NPDC006551]|uniref:DUF1254 domain-containing protein n=1 Tax=Streptomyces sp. NPDC006551 TaxID=3157178 RepID=UPI0033A1F948
MSTLSSDLWTLGHEAYVYLYPLVTMDITRLQMVNVEADAKPGCGPPNEFHHMREFPDATFRLVVRPNFDTLYSAAWLDLTAGPVVLHSPDTADRYFMLPMLDMWTDVFANPGKRTTGTDARDFVVVGPGYTGPTPHDLPVIAAPTPYVWVIGRTQTNGPGDYEAVHAVQDGYTLTTVNSAPAHVIDPDHDTTTEPLTLVNRMNAVEFFTHAARALAVNPPHLTDFSVLARIAHLGLVPGKEFDAGRFDAAQLSEIEAGVRTAREAILAALPTLGTKVNGWTTFTDTMGVYGNYYFKRAVVTAVGLGANPAEDAVYPVLMADADGEPLSGEHDYHIHFDADQLPPVHAFWSITMYDAEGFQVANELNRFALGDRDPLTYNDDGSLDILLQHHNPGPGKETNWLPTPTGPLGVTMRLYAPKPEAMDGRWNPPPVRKV